MTSPSRSNSRGFLRPRRATTQRGSIPSPLAAESFLRLEPDGSYDGGRAPIREPELTLKHHVEADVGPHGHVDL